MTISILTHAPRYTWNKCDVCLSPGITHSNVVYCRVLPIAEHDLRTEIHCLLFESKKRETKQLAF